MSVGVSIGIAPRPIDLLPLVRLGMLDELWSCETAGSTWSEESRVELLSLESYLGCRARWRTADLDPLLPLITERVANQPNSGARTIIPYGLTPEWRAALDGRLRSKLTVARSFARWPALDLRNKIRMRRWLSKLAVPLPGHVVATRASLDYHVLARRLGTPFVLQTPEGSGGAGTHLVEHRSDIDEVVNGNHSAHEWLASQYVAGCTVNVHGLADEHGQVAVGPPSVQLTDVSAAGAGFGEYCGSDFTAVADLPAALLERCRSFTARIGEALGDQGHNGLFGVDFAVLDGGPVALEVNTRVQASTWLLGEIELAAGYLPMLCRHVLQAHNQPVTGYREPSICQGAYLVLRHTGDTSEVADSPRQGAYSWDGTFARSSPYSVGYRTLLSRRWLWSTFRRPARYSGPVRHSAGSSRDCP